MPQPPVTMRTVLGHRSVRLTVTGVLCAATQLTLLSAFTHRGVPPLTANLAAFALAAHLNFLGSSAFTWGDRRGGSVVTRWLAFLAAVSGTAALNLAVFQAALTLLPVMVAAAAGIGVAATLNFLLGDRAIFRQPPEAVDRSRAPAPGASSATLTSTENAR